MTVRRDYPFTCLQESSVVAEHNHPESELTIRDFFFHKYAGIYNSKRHRYDCLC
jgi:hypothetical protein